MDDLERIKSQIDGPQEMLLVLADIHEERGENVLAEGYRILHAKGRWPKLLQGGGCEWYASHGWKTEKKSEALPENTPLPAWEFERISDALEAAALGVAWHERGVRLRCRKLGGTWGPLPCDPPPEAARAMYCYEWRCGPHLYGRYWDVGSEGVRQIPDGPVVSRKDGPSLLALWIAAGNLPKSAPAIGEKKPRKKRAAS